MRIFPARSTLAAIVAIGALGVAPALAQSPAEFYKGKTVTLLISSAAGGGYDTLARTIASYLGRHIPGAPAIIVKNMAGAGGIVATNYLYNVAPKDGTTIGGVQNNTPFEPLFGTKAATYDPLKFNWLGTPSIEVAHRTVWHTTPVNTWQDAQDTRNHDGVVGRATRRRAFTGGCSTKRSGSSRRSSSATSRRPTPSSPWSAARSTAIRACSTRR